MKINFRLDFPCSNGYEDLFINWPLKILPRIGESIEIEHLIDDPDLKEKCIEYDWTITDIKYSRRDNELMPIIDLTGSH